MLNCEICGEEVLLEEDMKTHLLLSHEENELCCPLCSLSGVSYDEMNFHISSAHPEDSSPDQSTSTSVCSAVTKTTLFGSSCLTAAAAEREGPSPGNTTSSSLRSKTRSGSSSNSKAKEKTLSPKKGAWRCPLCSAFCSDSSSLQEHVELCLEHGAAGSSAAGVDSDLELAQWLQEEEEHSRRQEEDRREKEEFKKLQRQFGVDSSGGYSRQMERSLDRAVSLGLMAPGDFHSKRAEMLETLSTGLDDGRTRTQGVIGALCDYYQTDRRDCVHVWLSADTDHFCSSAGDKGWGCGYRNFQMILSSLHRIDTYTSVLPERTVPNLPQLQRMIEEAWKDGLDAKGAAHFNQRLQGTRSWIGATEIYSLLTSLSIRAHIVDFHRPTGPSDTHPRLFEWVKQYFSQTSNSNRLPPRIICTSLPPLYLQHQGHSRTIMGLEQRKNGSLCLLLLDPASSISETRKVLSRESITLALRNIRKFSSSLKHHQYQVVALQGVLSAEEKQVRISKSRLLCAERIP